MKFWGWGTAVIGMVALIAGLALLAIAQQTPLLCDPEAFDAGVSALHARAQETGDFRQASRSFHPLRDLYGTSRGLLSDVGGALAAGGGLIALISFGLSRFAGVRQAMLQTHSILVVVLVALLSAVVIAGSAMLQAITLYGRKEVPPWADSLGVPMAGAAVMAPVLFVLLAVIAGAPHLRRRPRGAPIWIRPAVNVGGVIALIVYGLLALLLLFFAFVSAAQPAGWLTMLGALMGCWLMVHARAVASA